MKRIRAARWSTQPFASPPIARPTCSFRYPARQSLLSACRLQSTSASRLAAADSQPPSPPAWNQKIRLENLPSPPPSFALKSPKLSALHSRLSLPNRLPLQTLARTLVDPTADPSSSYNNAQLAILGADLLGYYTSEYLLCHFPRLPMEILMAAQWAYVGSKTLSSISYEWGIKSVAEPGGEVDSGLLQFRFAPPAAETGSRKERRGLNWRVVHDDQFGDSPNSTYNPSHKKRVDDEGKPTITEEEARSRFVQSVVGAVYLHCGRLAAYRFFSAHVLSRHLDLSKLFDFREPQRDLSRLCAREGLQSPVARLISETGRASRHPVYVVGVYSGNNKLGEGAGASLDEGRVRASAAALRSWYLYSPPDVTLPSSVEGVKPEEKKWVPNHIDCGEVVV